MRGAGEDTWSAELRRAADGSTFGTPADVNLRGVWTLYVKEVRRFLKVYLQTLAAPLITTLLFLAVFALALGGEQRLIGAVPYLEFLAPGLLVMAVVQNAFANTSSSLVIAKVQGNIVDYLMPPLAPGELVLGLVMGGITRGVLVGIVTVAAMLPFVSMGLPHPLIALASLLLAAALLSLLGFLAALWAQKFDEMAAVTNFLITPLSFLSGTFYSIHDLPEPWHLLAMLNPFFYMIDGVRYGMTGHADGHPWVGVAVLVVTVAVTWIVAVRLVRTGWRLKA